MSQFRPSLTESVGADRLFAPQTSDPSEGSATAREGGYHYYLVVARRGGYAYLDRVEVTADERRILVMKRHVDRVARTAHLLRRGNDRGAATKRRTHRRTELRMQERSRVLQFPGQPDNGCLAETLDWLTLE